MAPNTFPPPPDPLRPYMVQDMDLKQLVADAYTRGRMIAVLPFVEKVLSGCKDSKVCVGMGAPTCCHM